MYEEEHARVQEAGLQELYEVAVEQRVAQLAHIRRIALAQLLACLHERDRDFLSIILFYDPFFRSIFMFHGTSMVIALQQVGPNKCMTPVSA